MIISRNWEGRGAWWLPKSICSVVCGWACRNSCKRSPCLFWRVRLNDLSILQWSEWLCCRLSRQSRYINLVVDSHASPKMAKKMYHVLRGEPFPLKLGRDKFGGNPEMRLSCYLYLVVEATESANALMNSPLPPVVKSRKGTIWLHGAALLHCSPDI